jgi:hypothetical protein
VLNLVTELTDHASQPFSRLFAIALAPCRPCGRIETTRFALGGFDIVRTALLISGLALAAVATLAGCSGTGQEASSAIPSSGTKQTTSRSSVDAARTGVAPGFLTMLHFGHASSRISHWAGKSLKDLYVSDYGTDEVEVLKNKTYKEVRRIKKGLVLPDGEFLDSGGNFYVADALGADIAEYGPGGSSPSFVYSAGMTDPVDVTVDAKGNVYEAEYNEYGAVNEYAQGSNTIVNSCSFGNGVEGVAVDTKGDVFVDYDPMAYYWTIVEYKGGLAGCHANVEIVSAGFAGGMVIDKHGNLIMCDQANADIDVIDPPYDQITRTFTGDFFDPLHVTINKKNSLIFVADPANANVQILGYPNGNHVTTLSSGEDGLEDPLGAVDTPNAVY